MTNCYTYDYWSDIKYDYWSVKYASKDIAVNKKYILDENFYPEPL